MIFGYVFIILFSLLTFGGVAPGATAGIEGFIFTLFFLYLLRGTREGRVQIVPSPLNLAAVLFFCLIIYQLTGLPHSSIYRYATRVDFLKYLAYYLFFFLVANTLKTKREIYRLLLSVLVLVVALSFWGVAEKMADIHHVGAGPFINENHYANWLAMAIIFTFGLFLATGHVSPRSPRKDESDSPRWKNVLLLLDTPRPLLFMLVIFSSVGLFFSLSRGGISSFAVGFLFLGFLLMFHREFRGNALLIPALSLCLFSILFWMGADSIARKMFTIKEISLSSDQRILVWQSTLKIFRDFPIIGSGLGTFASIFPAYRSEAIIPKIFSFAHNEYLQLLSEVGIVGFLIFFAGFVVFFFRIIQQSIMRHDHTAVALTSAGVAGLCAGFVHALVDFPFRIPANGLLLALILGMVTITSQGRFSRDGSITLRFRTVTIHKKGIFRGLLILGYIFLLGVAIRPALAEYVARKDVLAALRFEPGNGRFSYLAGQSYLKSPEALSQEQALPHLLRAVRLDPYNAKYRQSLGWLYANLGYRDRAEEELRLAVRMDPTNPVRLQAYRNWFPGE